ncbi:uncharacterized protein B0I36DRAFT_331955 [Microdochium trichocladiopsis]|uniref:Apple domain-containing protein n=1 Tax=Microdochium trichocladiopsis TaxID=1682393 RepID=A0A9P8XY61_9PEZI|nr:uncharacterized protein B0I36DRAFT_331955 [Microdochium trichocladiopsis]KAH7024725.1 hypothetical protein B0I36DRAFT_331955 [Microdochium trichocladiopsis]
MKSTLVLSLVLATTAVQAGSRRRGHRCGGGPSLSSSVPSLSSSSPSSSSSSSSSSTAATGTICTSTSTEIEAETVTTTLTTTPATVTTVTTQTETTTTTTTLDQSTSTFSTTTTVFETSTATDTALATATSVVTSTLTTPAATVTVERSPDFTPIQSVYGPGGISARRPQQQANQAARTAGDVDVFALADATHIDLALLPDCTSTVGETTTITQMSTSTVNTEAPTPTATSTETQTVTSTSSVLQSPASSTTTITQTDKVTTTTTTTRTTTETSTTVSTETAGPTPTFYAACAGTDNGGDNALSSYRGVMIGYSRNILLRLVRNPGVGAGYACCAACEANPNCRASFYSRLVDSCYRFDAPLTPGSPTCAPERVAVLFEPAPIANDLTLYNSNCGQWGLLQGEWPGSNL